MESLRAGITWDWETIPEYVAMLERRRLGPNVGVLLGHSAIRAYVLGDAAYARARRRATKWRACRRSYATAYCA